MVKFQKTESVSDSINTNATDIIYTAIGKKEGYGSGDLYISFKETNNWTVGKNLGKKSIPRIWTNAL